MPAQLTVREICESALRKIGAVGIYEDPDPELMFLAGRWLDMIVGHVAGNRRRTYFLIQPIQIPLVADTRAYVIKDSATDGTWPEPGLHFPVAAWVTQGDDDHRYDVEIVGKRDFDDLADPSETGRPTCCYIDRLYNKTVYVWPVPADADYTLHVTAQRFSNDLTLEKRSDRAMKQPERAMDLTPTWNLWAVTALAAQLGGGAVRRLPDGEVRDLQQQASDLLGDLDGFEDQEHGDTALQQTVYKDF